MACLQAQLMQVKAQLAHDMMDTRSIENHHQWQGNCTITGVPSFPSSYPGNYANPISPQSSLESADCHNNDGMNNMQEIESRSDEFSFQGYPHNYRKRPYNNTDLGELQALALRMMRN